MIKTSKRIIRNNPRNRASLLLSGALFLGLSIWLLSSMVLTYRTRMQSLIYYQRYYQMQALSVLPEKDKQIKIDEFTISRTGTNGYTYRIISKNGKIITEEKVNSSDRISLKE